MSVFCCISSLNCARFQPSFLWFVLQMSLLVLWVGLYHCRELQGGQVDTAVRKFANKEVSWSSQGMLRLTPFAMKRLFQPTLDRIKQAIGDVLNNPNARGLWFVIVCRGMIELRFQRRIYSNFCFLTHVMVSLHMLPRLITQKLKALYLICLKHAPFPSTPAIGSARFVGGWGV